jgi:thiopurine S-methyltransferase
MDRTFWLERWHRREIGFHQEKVQTALEKHWSSLNLAKGATVFVPLAGKSLDMFWLREQGYRVVGVELSEVAVAEFFSEHGLTPTVRKDGPFTVSFADQIELWCGDFFALKTSDLPPLDAAYDRAALVAMPDDMQPRYAAKMAELMPAHSQTLLLGLDYNQSEMKGPPFAIPDTDIRKLFESNFTVGVLGVRDGLAKSDHLRKRGVTRLEEATYLLKRRA